MTPFKNQEKILNDITLELCSLAYPKSWNIVVPPCFYAGTFASSLHDRLKQKIPAARVALIEADAVFSPKEFIIQIHYEWTGKTPHDVETDVPPNILLAKLLNTIGNGRNVLIISEFHKILGRMDERVLVALRSAEQAGRINTIAISIYPHKWLRVKWKKEGHLLNVSNYGDHHHCLGVEPFSDKDITRLLSKEVVPTDLVRMLYEWTGGIPECLDRTVEDWIGAGRPNLTPQIVDLLRRKACDSLERFVKFMDSDGSSRFSQFVIDIHQHVNEAESYNQLSRYHPWAHIILDGDGLRVDTLGDAVTQMQMEEAFQIGKIAESLSAVADLSIRYYRFGQYDRAIQVIQHYRETYDSARLHLIELHSRIMIGLCGGVSASPCPDVVDTEWSSVIQATSKARTMLLKVVKEEEKERKERMLERYNEIENLAKFARKATENGDRYLDRIGGLHGDEPDRDSAFTLAVFQCESGRSISGNTTACKSVIELPEQILRLWAFWKHNINYYDFTNKDPQVLARLEEIWPTHVSQLVLPSLGKQFSSLYLFCYYLFALEDCKHVKIPTWQTQNILDQELSMLITRNDMSHASVHINAKIRKKLFAYIDIWLSRLEGDCMGKTNRDLVMSKVEPLEVF